MTRALVTGATGFLGGHMVQRLKQMGWEVTATGRNEQAGQSLRAQGIHFVQADLRDRERVLRLCAGQDYVFHCGALSSPWGAYREFYGSNVEATRHIADGCKEAEVQRLIHISTPSVYFDYRPRYLIQESDPLPTRPANHYAATKLLAEQLLTKRWHQQQLPVIMLRPRAIFGPQEQALLPRLLRTNQQSGVPLLNGGQAEIDLTYVDNVLDAMLLACYSSADTLGQVYNISNGQALPFEQLVNRLFALLDIPLRTRRVPYAAAYSAAAVMETVYRVLPLSGEPALTRYTVGSIAVPHTLDIRLAQEQLGYTPKISVDQGLQYFADWWKEQQVRL